jgi:hypothetical protein
VTTLWRQLGTGSGTEGEDCGAASDINGLYLLSGGKLGPDMVRPAREPQSMANWVKFVRRLANRPRGALFVYGDMTEALGKLRAAFKARTGDELRIDYRYGMAFGDLREWLRGRQDRCAIVAYQYGIARKDGAVTASESFNGSHVSVWTNVRRRRIKVGNRYIRRWMMTNGDSLFDGRAKPGGGRYPKGYQTVRMYRYRRACGAFGAGPDGYPRPIGFGRVICILMERV